MEVLDEAEGRIRIEDVLPLFPDFVTIDAFKGAICASLEDYKAQIDRLKAEMGDATRMADALRYALVITLLEMAVLGCSTCQAVSCCLHMPSQLRMQGGLSQPGRWWCHE